MATRKKSFAPHSYKHVKGMSREALLAWVNSKVNGQYDDIEELSTGVAYCQIIETFSPKSIAIKKVKVPAKFQHEQLHNLRILQNALHHLKADKVVPIGNLVKARFLENFHFLQWFKKFYDNQKCYNETEEMTAKISMSSLILEKKNSKQFEMPFASESVLERSTMISKEITSSESDDSEICQQEEIIELTETFEQLQTEILEAEWQRSKAINLLLKVKELLRKSIENGEDIEFCKTVLNDVYMEN